MILPNLKSTGTFTRSVSPGAAGEAFFRDSLWMPHVDAFGRRRRSGDVIDVGFRRGGVRSLRSRSTYPTSQRPHLTGDGHTKPILTEVKDQVLLGLWTCRDRSVDSWIGTESQAGLAAAFAARSLGGKEDGGRRTRETHGRKRHGNKETWVFQRWGHETFSLNV